MKANTPECDWCGATMRQIADRGSGMAPECYAIWLCNNPTCGHELEIIKPVTGVRISGRVVF